MRPENHVAGVSRNKGTCQTDLPFFWATDSLTYIHLLLVTAVTHDKAQCTPHLVEKRWRVTWQEEEKTGLLLSVAASKKQFQLPSEAARLCIKPHDFISLCSQRKIIYAYENIISLCVCLFGWFFPQKCTPVCQNLWFILTKNYSWLWKIQVCYFQSLLVSFSKFIRRRSPTALLNIILSVLSCAVFFTLLNKFPSCISKELDEVDITACLEFTTLNGATQKHITAFYSMHPYDIQVGI